jgi:LysM repeat protein
MILQHSGAHASLPAMFAKQTKPLLALRAYCRQAGARSIFLTCPAKESKNEAIQMFFKIKTNFSLLFCLVFLTASFTSGQTRDISGAEALINSVTEKAGAHFKVGLIALKDNLRPQAREQFDKAIEVFLMSTLNVQRNPKLQDCYNQLVDTVYLIEFPSNQKPPQIKTLSATCGWNINDQLANDVAKFVSTLPQNNNNPYLKPTDDKDVGFTEQKFEASQLDEFPKLELQEEQTIVYPGSQLSKTTPTNPVRVAKAKAGDTVSTLATREKVSPVEVAKLNGLLPTSKLTAGREIKIPTSFSISQESLTTACGMTLREAPALRGLKFGMTPLETGRALGISVVPTAKTTKISFRKVGEDYVEILSVGNKAEYEKNKRELRLGEETFYYARTSLNLRSPQLEGIVAIYMQFYKNSLYYISVMYDSKEIKWVNHREFLLNISKKLTLPKSSWRITDNVAVLSCTDFSLTSLFGEKITTLMLFDLVTQNAVDTDAKKRFIELDKKENMVDYEKKKEFKP